MKQQRLKRKEKMIMNDVSALIQFRKLNIAYIKILGNVLSNQHHHRIEDDGGPRSLHLAQTDTARNGPLLLQQNIKHFNNCPLHIFSYIEVNAIFATTERERKMYKPKKTT